MTDRRCVCVTSARQMLYPEDRRSCAGDVFVLLERIVITEAIPLVESGCVFLSGTSSSVQS